jgi:hypothetical protein
MKWDPRSLSRFVAVIGDRGSLPILQECFLRGRWFEAFGRALGRRRDLALLEIRRPSLGPA